MSKSDEILKSISMQINPKLWIYFTFVQGMSEEAIMELNLPTGIPIVYELDKNLKPLGPMQFLGDEETVKKAMEAVAAQGKAKK